jgi:hypothetical protein
MTFTEKGHWLSNNSSFFFMSNKQENDRVCRRSAGKICKQHRLPSQTPDGTPNPATGIPPVYYVKPLILRA